ncbi:hypothetical protein HY793_01565 [Candidatus Desantisbacteria bacterium]|nr:hypothetical protein [Candidatus Desantisbacteria bacterium]
MDLNEKQKDLLAQKIIDFGNLAIVALSFGSLLTDKINWWLFSVGMILFIGSYVYGISLRNRGGG